MEQIFYSKKIPILQNKVYSNHNEALLAPAGEIGISIDTKTNLAFNKYFDSQKMIYDKDYDNSVPSKIFTDYYDELADYLITNYDLNNGVIIDIGCGKGTFLSRMADRYPYIKGLGIDPSYEGKNETHDGRINFINEYFSKDHISNIDSISLVLCRHTLEHIPLPINFLQSIFSVLSAKEYSIPVFIEVPDLIWTLENKAFWDFCYEHVNYFTQESLSNCLTYSGAKIKSTKKAFNGQYIWSESEINTKEVLSLSNIEKDFISYKDFSIDLDFILNETISKIKRLKNNSKIVIWGMATKGVIFSLHLLNNDVMIDFCIDINKNKQSKYAPITSYKIESPNVLKENEVYSIICMNPNYSKEINEQCKNLNLNFKLYDPQINLL